MAWEVQRNIGIFVVIQKCAFYHQEQGGKPPKIGTSCPQTLGWSKSFNHKKQGIELA